MSFPPTNPNHQTYGLLIIHSIFITVFELMRYNCLLLSIRIKPIETTNTYYQAAQKANMILVVFELSAF